MSSCGAVDHLHVGLLQNLLVVIASVHRHSVVLVCETEEALGSARRVLGSLAVIAVGEEHDESILNVPLRLAGRNKLVDDYLRSVGEVSELSFPEHKRVRVGLSIAKLVSEHSELR